MPEPAAEPLVERPASPRAEPARPPASRREPSFRLGRQAWVVPGVALGAAVPGAWILLRFLRGGLGANPIAEVLNELGLMALALLLASLTCTPLKTLTGWTWPLRARKALGLAAFAYALLHVSTYVGLDQGLDLRAIYADVMKRKFIEVGLLAFVLLVPLALTSTDAMVRRLGFRRWKLLHRLVYLAAAAGVVHFVWRVKKDLREPLVYAAVLATLLAVRALLALARSLRARGTSH